MISDLWYKNAVIYSLSLDSFLDSNGDGVGDFQGAICRLDYLQGLGITAIWLMPFQPSPGRDLRSWSRRVLLVCGRLVVRAPRRPDWTR